MRKVMNGANRKLRKRKASWFLNGKVNRASAYAARMPVATDSATAPVEISTLLRKKRGKSGRVEAYAPRCLPRKSAS